MVHFSAFVCCCLLIAAVATGMIFSAAFQNNYGMEGFQPKYLSDLPLTNAGLPHKEDERNFCGPSNRCSMTNDNCARDIDCHLQDAAADDYKNANLAYLDMDENSSTLGNPVVPSSDGAYDIPFPQVLVESTLRAVDREDWVRSQQRAREKSRQQYPVPL